MDYNTQDTRSFDSYLSSTTEVDYFTALPLIETLRRTTQLGSTFGIRRIIPWTVVCMVPSFVVAALTAAVHTEKVITDPTQLHSLTAFDEVWDALPLVTWHVVVMGLGALAAQCVVVRFLAEFYGRRALYTPVRTSLWITALRHGGLVLAAGLFSVGSLAVVYLFGHVLTVGASDLRQDATRAHAKNPMVFGTIAVAAVIMMLLVDGFVLFAMLWLAVMYVIAIPIILLEQPDSPIEVFRQAYVLARDSRSYLLLSWTLLSLPALLVTLLMVLPWHALSRGQADFVEWQLGTLSGVMALYVPLTLIWLPLLSIHQTVLYMTLRVVKDGLTLEMLQGDLDRAAPTYAMVGANAGHDDSMPLTLGPTGLHDFQDDGIIDEQELQQGNHQQQQDEYDNIELADLRTK